MLLYREGAIDARFAIGNTPTEGLLPVLILHGTLDTNTEPSGSQHFCDRIGSVDKTLKLYEGSFHDLLNDIDKSVVMQDIQDWINVRIPAALAARLPWVNFPCIELGRAVFTPAEIKEGQQNEIYGKQRSQLASAPTTPTTRSTGQRNSDNGLSRR